MQNKHPKAVENYTDAFLCSFGLLIFMGLFTLAAIFGFFWAIMAALTLNLGITYLIRRFSQDEL
jgi:hypothetical protein